MLKIQKQSYRQGNYVIIDRNTPYVFNELEDAEQFLKRRKHNRFSMFLNILKEIKGENATLKQLKESKFKEFKDNDYYKYIMNQYPESELYYSLSKINITFEYIMKLSFLIDSVDDGNKYELIVYANELNWILMDMIEQITNRDENY